MLRNFPSDRNPAGAACPTCRTPGSLRPHGSYERWLKRDERSPMERVRIRRGRCDGCHATHALLPEGVIPYNSFGTRLMFAVCVARKRGDKVEDICSRFQISPRVLYRILERLPGVSSMLESIRPGGGGALLREAAEGPGPTEEFLARFARMPFEKVTLPQPRRARARSA